MCVCVCVLGMSSVCEWAGRCPLCVCGWVGGWVGVRVWGVGWAMSPVCVWGVGGQCPLCVCMFVCVCRGFLCVCVCVQGCPAFQDPPVMTLTKGKLLSHQKRRRWTPRHKTRTAARAPTVNHAAPF